MKNLAKVIVLAAEIHETSYNYEAGKYRISISDALTRVVKHLGFDEEYETPAFIMLTVAWNDALAWALEHHHSTL